MQMNFKGAQERAQTALKVLDTLSANGTLRPFGLFAIQQMAGATGILEEIVQATEMKDETSEEV